MTGLLQTRPASGVAPTSGNGGPCGARLLFDRVCASVGAELWPLLESAPMWFWATDAAHRFVALSDTWMAATGGRREDYIGLSRLKCLCADGAPGSEIAAHLRCLEARAPFRDFSYRHAFRGDSTLWITAAGTPVFDADGGFEGYVGTEILLSATRDGAAPPLHGEPELLARTNALQQAVSAHLAALDTSHGLLSDVLESMDQGLLVYAGRPGAEPEVVLSNARFARLMDLPDGFARPGRAVRDILDHCAARGDFRHLAGGRRMVQAATLAERPLILSPGGAGRFVLFNPVRRASAGTVVTVTDVTDIEQRRHALDRARHQAQEANRLLSEVVEAMGEGLLVTSGDRLNDPGNEILLVNPAYRSLFGLTEDEIAPGMKMADFISALVARGDAPSPDRFEEIDRQLNAGQQVMMDIPFSGRSYFARANRRPSGGFVLVHTDITELQQRARQLDLARRAADAANQAKSEFLAAMSHEIRTPMNGIIGMAELLTETALTPQQELFARTILDSGIALTEVIGEILDFSRIEAGKLVLAHGPVDLMAVAGDVRRLLLARAGQAGLDLRLTGDPAMPRHWMGDGTRLRQILINLVGNAIKFTHLGHVEISVSRAEQGDGVVIAVEDTGIGIPADRIEAIFDAFEQVDHGDGKVYGGTGLGLKITRRLAELMGGSLTVSSVPGQGARFEARLPLRPATAPPPPDQHRGCVDCGMRLHGRHVLVAEDNRTNRLLLEHMLTPLGLRLTFCADGIETVACHGRGGIDVILMDVSMPRQDGLSATRDIRRHEAEGGLRACPIIALTGNATAHDRLMCLEAGMNGFLTKPLRKATLVDELLRVLPPGPCRRPEGKQG